MEEPQTLFPDTRWSLVVDVKNAPGDAAARALGELCQAYWFPLYSCARRAGLSPQDSEDCVQGFFARLVERRSIGLVAQEKGRLRSFFRVALKNYITEQWHKERRLKRGGGAVHLSIDQEWAEGQLDEGADGATDSDAVFDQEWAQTLLNAVFSRLEDHYSKSDRTELFQAIRGSLVGGGKYGAVETIAEELGLSSAAVRSAVFKLRRRFREYIEAEVRDTCADEEEMRDEVRHLCKILAR